jgi:predicted nucleotidyltransferase
LVVVTSIETVLEALNRAGVRYLVVGGVAVVLHGHLRTTADLDLVVQLDRTNLLKALRSLNEIGFRPRVPVALEDLADPAIRKSWIEEKNMMVFSLWHPDLTAFDVDLFVQEPFNFDEVWERRIDVALDRTIAPVIGLEDLINLKLEAGRPRDIEDVGALKTLAERNHDQNA